MSSSPSLNSQRLPTSSPPASHWTRRNWLATNAVVLASAAVPVHALHATAGNSPRRAFDALVPITADTRIDPSAWEALAEHAVAAAVAAGAQYADARLTRIAQQLFRDQSFRRDTVDVAVGVRALVNGYWGFAAGTDLDRDSIAQIAQNATAQAKGNATGTPRTVELGHVPVARGRWETPVKIDPFTVPIEEKLDFISGWFDLDARLAPTRTHIPAPNAGQMPLAPIFFPQRCGFNFARQERVTATSEGALFTQTFFESTGVMYWGYSPIAVQGIRPAAKGWELMLEANIPDQIRAVESRLIAAQLAANRARPAIIGRETIVCDGYTMAALLEQTLGLATQLDRIFGYEANATGTSFLSDPLAMLGSFQVASPSVTVTANRSAPGQLATVKWDDEGVTPDDVTLVKNGVWVDCQTTRESASWLSPYYQKSGRPTRSHGHAMSQNAVCTPLQQMPNLALAPSAGAVSLDDLIGTVASGILITNASPPEGLGSITGVEADQQARNGWFGGAMSRIKNGRVDAPLGGAEVLFNTLDLWKNVTVIGGAATVQTAGTSQYPNGPGNYLPPPFGLYPMTVKGQPVQLTSHSVSAPAAVITKQALVDPTRRT